MIQTKPTEKGILHYSDAGMKLRQIETGIIYDDADDILPCPYTYEETDIPIEEEEIDAAEALAIITGGGA